MAQDLQTDNSNIPLCKIPLCDMKATKRNVKTKCE